MSISKVMIFGSGSNGSGTRAFAQSGFEKYLMTIKEEFVQRGIVNIITKQLARSVEKGRMSEEEKENLWVILDSFNFYEDAKNVQLVIEAALQKTEISNSASFKQLDEITAPETILASNTSSLSITDIAAAHSSRTCNFPGMHFFLNPAPVMKLVEVIRTLQPDEVVKAVAN